MIILLKIDSFNQILKSNLKLLISNLDACSKEPLVFGKLWDMGSLSIPGIFIHLASKKDPFYNHCSHPKKTRENRDLSRKLISKWSRPIYNPDTEITLRLINR
jgi:hypothetical protein